MLKLVITQTVDYLFNALTASLAQAFNAVIWNQEVKNPYQMYEDFKPEVIFVHYTQYTSLLKELIIEYKLQVIFYGYKTQNEIDSLTVVPPNLNQHTTNDDKIYCLKYAANVLQINKGFKQANYQVDLACMIIKDSPTLLRQFEELDNTVNVFSLYNKVDSPYFIGAVSLGNYRHIIKSCKINIAADDTFTLDYAFNKCFALGGSLYPKFNTEQIEKFLSNDSRKERNQLIVQNYELAKENTYLHRARDILELLQMDTTLIEKKIAELC